MLAMQAPKQSARYRVLAIVSPSLSTDILAELPQRLQCDINVRHELSAGRNELVLESYDAVLAEVCVGCVEETRTMVELRDVRPNVRVIFLVHDSTTQHVIEAMRAQAFSYFSGPFDWYGISNAIQTAATTESAYDDIELLSGELDFLTVTLTCSLAAADRLIQFMSEIPSPLSDEDRREVAMAFRELLMNAIEHGGKLNPEERVRVSRVRTRRTVVYAISDSGVGFSRLDLAHAAVANPEDPMAHVPVREQAGMRCGGFGMLIASRLVDEVIYNERGNEVILIKYLE